MRKSDGNRKEKDAMPEEADRNGRSLLDYQREMTQAANPPARPSPPEQGPADDAVGGDAVGGGAMSDEVMEVEASEDGAGEAVHEALYEVGLVDGSDRNHATSEDFHVTESGERVVQLDDLLYTEQTLPDGRSMRHYGIVTGASSFLEGASLPGDTRMSAAEGGLPTEESRYLRVKTLRLEPEVWVAPRPGARVVHARGEARAEALFKDKMARPMPAGLDQAGLPIWADLRFLDGEAGGHLSISGVSGVATKTSYAMFLMYMLFESQVGRSLMGPAAAGTRALVFNVKGEDLCHLDQPSSAFDENARRQWAALGVEKAAPFSGVSVLAPPRPGGSPAELQPTLSSRPKTKTEVYGYTPWTFVREGLLEHLLQLAPDSNMSWLEERVRLQLARHAHPLRGEADTGAIVMADPSGAGAGAGNPASASMDFEQVVSRTPREKMASEGFVVRDFRDLLAYVEDRFEGDFIGWTDNAHDATISAFRRRLRAQRDRGGALVRCGVAKPGTRGAVTVVDINSLHEDAQRFVVGVSLRDIYAEKQGAGRLPLRIVMLDELNQYAPKGADSPIKEQLKEIGTQGRSRGVILFGCQQLASDVDEKVATQASLKACGRLDASEASHHAYLSAELKTRVAKFTPGRMVLHQPLIPEATPLSFPRSPYATNASEVGGDYGREGERGANRVGEDAESRDDERPPALDL